MKFERRFRSDSMVTKLVNYALTRGMLTAVTQIMAFIMFLVDYPNHTLWFMLFYIPASTLYVNSLLAMWNARRYVMWSNEPPSRPSGISTWRLNIDTALGTQED
ncbi:hypothetical protein C8Q72DRAFT_866376 [Fomitopsis betulina]|nr:hypothetical protein C8Q72DRAFT_866376 [Fomitopsis betulina]